MGSAALTSWQTTRAARLDELLAAHETIGGAGSGRRWRTEQLNWALTLRLAGEFQGYARELHDLAVDEYVRRTTGSHPITGPVLRSLLTSNRHLDKGNATPGTLGADFGRFGLRLWQMINFADRRGAGWNLSLDRLNDARNAVAHDNPAKLQQLRVDGWPLTLKSVKRWRTGLDGLTVTVDGVIADYVEDGLGPPRPW